MSSRALMLAMAAVGNKFGYRDLTDVRRKIEEQLTRPASYAPPRRLDRTCVVTASFRYGWPCYRVGPREGAPRVRVVYLHGGAYIEEIGSNHWLFVKELATKGACEVVVPVYPLAPRGTAGEFVPAVMELARSLTGDDALPTVFMGDSAGGGLAVVLAQRLRDEGAAGPARLELIAPWLDVTLGNPAIPDIEPYDPMLGAAALRYTGALWADGLDPSAPMVSPLNGTLAGLPPTTVYAGTHDILTPDARRFRDLAASDGVTVELCEAYGQIHAYPLWPTREARDARHRILANLHRAGRTP